jgi:nucleotidyltransferase/DNA polymerase involved in DNA repair
MTKSILDGVVHKVSEDLKKTLSSDSKVLTRIPGVGKSIANDLQNIGINSVNDLIGKDPEKLYRLSNNQADQIQDRCLLYVFRCAVYYAEGGIDPQKLKWWNWKD